MVCTTRRLRKAKEKKVREMNITQEKIFRVCMWIALFAVWLPFIAGVAYGLNMVSDAWFEWFWVSVLGLIGLLNIGAVSTMGLLYFTNKEVA